MPSSTYAQQVSPNEVPINANEDILDSNISITREMVSPGGAGTLRLLFSFVFAAESSVITVYNNGSPKGNLNTDNFQTINNNGYYRFDIDVEEGDEINLRSSANITAINFVRAHLVVIGA